MIKNNKGTILVIAVTAMVIMIIIGYICLQMYMNQTLMDTYDVTKKRLFYSAEGAIEAMRGSINAEIDKLINPKTYPPTPPGGGSDDMGGGVGFLASRPGITNTNGWKPVNLDTGVLHPFDGSMHPPVNVNIFVKRITSLSDDLLKNTGFSSTEFNTFKAACKNSAVGNNAYVIVATSSATHNTALIGSGTGAKRNNMSLTLYYYFYTEHINLGTASAPRLRNWPKFVGWRIEN